MVQGIGKNIEKAIKALIAIAIVGVISILGWVTYGIYLAVH